MTKADNGSMYELVREQPPLERLSADSAQADLERLYRITWTLHGGLPFTRFCELRRALIPDDAQPQQEPVAWRVKFKGDTCWTLYYSDPRKHPDDSERLGLQAVQPLYTAQPPAAPVETAFRCPCCGASGTTDGKSSTVRGPVSRSSAEAARPTVTDWEDVEQRNNVTCKCCGEKLWACRNCDPDTDEQRMPR